MDYVRLASEAGLYDWWESGNESIEDFEKLLEEFARLVQMAEREHQEHPEPIAWVKSSEWDAALKKKQSFNGWRINYGDCDMALYDVKLK